MSDDRRHVDAIAILDDLMAVAAQQGYLLGYHVNHLDVTPDEVLRADAEMKQHWRTRLGLYHARGHAGAHDDLTALPDNVDDHLQPDVLLEVIHAEPFARVVRCVPLDTLLGNSSAVNVGLVRDMCRECGRRAKQGATKRDARSGA